MIMNDVIERGPRSLLELGSHHNGRPAVGVAVLMPRCSDRLARRVVPGFRVRTAGMGGTGEMARQSSTFYIDMVWILAPRDAFWRNTLELSCQASHRRR